MADWSEIEKRLAQLLDDGTTGAEQHPRAGSHAWSRADLPRQAGAPVLQVFRPPSERPLSLRLDE